jgi:hypothetical protein
MVSVLVIKDSQYIDKLTLNFYMIHIQNILINFMLLSFIFNVAECLFMQGKLKHNPLEIRTASLRGAHSRKNVCNLSFSMCHFCKHCGSCASINYCSYLRPRI